jgi:hypothetical protein
MGEHTDGLRRDIQDTRGELTRDSKLPVPVPQPAAANVAFMAAAVRPRVS